MKKWMSFLLAAVLLLGLHAYPAFADTAAGTEPVRETDLVFYLKILDRESFDGTKIPTRGELVSAVLKTAGIGSTESAELRFFTDVDASHPFAAEINTAARLGIIHGDEESRFLPDEPSSLEQAAKMLVEILGYGVKTEPADYPAGYLREARMCGVLSGSEPVYSWDVLLGMLYRALNADMMQAAAIGAEETEYRVTKGKTLLSENHKLFQIKGAVTGDSTAAAEGGGLLPQDELEIDGQRYQLAADCPAQELLGLRIIAYYAEQDTQKTVVFYTLDPQNRSVTIQSGEIESFSGTVLTDVDRRRYTIAENAVVILNGDRAASYTEEDICVDYGTVTLVSTQGNGAYDLVKVSRYENYVVYGKDEEALVVYDKFQKPALSLFGEEDQKNIRLLGPDGETLRFADLKTGDVLTVVQNLRGDIITAHVSADTASGTVTSLNLQDTYPKVRVGETEYEAVPGLDSALRVGMSGTFRLDFTGRICDVVPGAYGSRTGVFIKSRQDTGFDNTVELKIFTDLGAMEVFPLRNKLELDGEENTSAVTAARALGDERQVVVFETDSQGRIRKLDTRFMGAAEDKAQCLTETFALVSGTLLKFKSGSRTFANRVNIDDEGIIFLMPPKDKLNDDALYTLVGTQYFENDGSYTVGAYNYGENRGMTDVLLVEESYSEPRLGMLFLVDEVATVYQDGENRIQISGYENGKAVSYLTEASFVWDETLQKGDAVRLAVNHKSEIMGMEKVYTHRDDQLFTDPQTQAFDTYFRAVRGYLYLRDDFIGKVTIKDPSAEAIGSSDFAETYFLPRFMVYRCNLDAKTGDVDWIETVDYESLKDFVHNGGARSKVLVQTRSGEPKVIVVYE